MTKGIIALLTGVLSILQNAPPQPLPSPKERLTVDEAVRLAEESAFGVRIAEVAVLRAQAQVGIARAQLGPTVTLDGSYQRFDRASSSNFGGNRVITSPIDLTRMDLGIALPIDLSGNIRRTVQANQRFLDASRQTVGAERNDLRMNVRQGFYQALQAAALVAVNQEAVRNAKEQLNVTTAQLAEGALAEIDRLRAETQLRQAETSLIAAQSQYTLAKQRLNNIIGRPIEIEFEPVGADELPRIPRTPDAYVQAAVSNRPDLASTRLRIEGLRRIREAESNGRFPTVSLGVTGTQYVGETGFGARAQSGVGILRVNFPVFDAGLTRERARSARADELSALLQLQQAELGVSLEVRSALTTALDALDRFDTAVAGERLAAETYRLALVRLREGAGIQLEVTDAQTQLTQARTNVVNARYDYLIALAQLRRAVASDDLTGPAAPGSSPPPGDARQAGSTKGEQE